MSTNYHLENVNLAHAMQLGKLHIVKTSEQFLKKYYLLIRLHHTEQHFTDFFFLIDVDCFDIAGNIAA